MRINSTLPRLISTLVTSVLLYASCSQASTEEAIKAYETGNHTLALRLFNQQASANDANAQFYLGIMYEKGEGVKANPIESFNWYKKAADLKHPVAQFNVAYMYSKGLGVAKSDQQAFEWYEKAANQGLSYAQNNLANLYEMGIGTTQNDQQAAYWYEKAANQGLANAKIRLARLTENGSGNITKNPELALKLYKQALDTKDNSADLAFAKERILAIEAAKELAEKEKLAAKNIVIEETVSSPTPTANTPPTGLTINNNPIDLSSCTLMTEHSAVEKKFKHPIKSGNYVYITAIENETVCVVDARGDVVKRTLKKDESININVNAPVFVSSKNLINFKIFWQGKPLNLKSNPRVVRLVEEKLQ